MNMESRTGPGFLKNFDFGSSLLANRYPLIALFLGLILIGLGAFYIKSGGMGDSPKVEVLSDSTEAKTREFVVEVGGAVQKPGVYALSSESRVDEALVLAGGLSAEADREWVERTLNRAAKIIDGQKIYIPETGEKTSVSGGVSGSLNAPAESQSSLVNINSATLSELDKLPGIGPVYGQSIIDHRPYSTLEELVSKGALKQGVYEKIKEKVSVY